MQTGAVPWGSWALAPGLGLGSRSRVWQEVAAKHRWQGVCLGPFPGPGLGLWPTVCVRHSRLSVSVSPTEDHVLQTSALWRAFGRCFRIVLLGMPSVWGAGWPAPGLGLGV